MWCVHYGGAVFLNLLANVALGRHAHKCTQRKLLRFSRESHGFSSRAVGRVHNVGQPMLTCSPDPSHSSVRIGSQVAN